MAQTKVTHNIENTQIALDAAEIPNLAASKITSGTFADARIASSNVSQHATSFDDNKLVNDISTLAIRQASNENKTAYNSNSMSVDVFQDDTGIASNTNAPRNSSEFVSTVATSVIDVSNNSTTFTDASDENHTINQASGKWVTSSGGALGGSAGISTSHSGNGYVYITNNNSFIHQMGSSDFTIEMFVKSVGSTDHRGIIGFSDSGIQQYQIATHGSSALKWWASNDGSNWNMGSGQRVTLDNMDGQNSNWNHIAVVRSSNAFYGYSGGHRRETWNGSGALYDENSDLRIGSTGNVNDTHQGYIDQIRISNTARYTGGTYTVPTGSNGYTKDSNTKLIIGSRFTGTVANATGNFISNAITAPSSTSKMGAIITYQDQAGTNTLNTDIVLQLSADNGSNFATATMTALPDFATGIKMAKVNDLAVTAGTQLKYKISFANQASGSKEARIRGVSLQY